MDIDRDREQNFRIRERKLRDNVKSLKQLIMRAVKKIYRSTTRKGNKIYIHCYSK